MTKYKELWDEIKNQIKTANGGEQIEYKKDFMKSRLELDDNLSLGQTLSIPGMIIVVKSVCQEDNIYHSLVCLYECVYQFANEL